MKRILIVLFVVFIVLTLSACSLLQTTLDAPTNLKVEHNIARWNSIEGARNYYIYIDGNEMQSTTLNSLDLSSLGLTVGQEYTIQVKTGGDGYIKLGSGLSNSVSFMLEHTNTTPEGGGSSNNQSTGNTTDNTSGNTTGNEPFVFVDNQLHADVVAPEGDMPKVIDSYTDETYNYFLLDAGYIRNAYISTLCQVDYTGVPISFSKTTTSSSAVTDTLSTMISDSYSVLTKNSGKVGLSTVKFIESLEWTHSKDEAISTSKSTSKTSTTAKQYGEAQTISYSFGNNTHVAGRYRYAIYSTVDVYYVVKTSLDNQSLLSWEVSACARPNDYFLRSEYSSNGIFSNEPNNNVTCSEDFFKQLPQPTNTIPHQWLPTTTYINAKVVSCGKDNHYNYSKPDVAANNIHYSHEFEFGKFVVDRAVTSENSNVHFHLSETEEKIGISFRLEYNSASLPTQDTMTSRFVCNDTESGPLYNMPYNVGATRVGFGLIVALIEYKDGSPAERICINNAFKNKPAGTVIEIFNGINKPCTINISICYELEMWAPGTWGLPGNYWMNWRINQVFFVD